MLSIGAGTAGEPAVNMLSALLDVLTNPDAAKATLAELRLASDKAIADRQLADEASTSANTRIEEARKQIDAAARALSEVTAAQADLDATVKMLADRERKLKEREETFEAESAKRAFDLEAREDAVTRAERDAATRTKLAEGGLKTREEAVAAREAEASTLMASATAMKDEYAKKLKALQQITS